MRKTDLSAVKEVAKALKNFTSVYRLIRVPYWATFFKYACSHLSVSDYSQFLSFLWQQMEFPNMDENVKPYEFVRYFKKADKNMLMEADELLFIKRSPMKFWYIEGSVKEEMSRHFHGLWTWKRRNGLQNGLVKNLRYIAQKSRKKMCWHTLTVEENQNWC